MIGWEYIRCTLGTGTGCMGGGCIAIKEPDAGITGDACPGYANPPGGAIDRLSHLVSRAGDGGTATCDAIACATPPIIDLLSQRVNAAGDDGGMTTCGAANCPTPTIIDLLSHRVNAAGDGGTATCGAESCPTPTIIDLLSHRVRAAGDEGLGTWDGTLCRGTSGAIACARPPMMDLVSQRVRAAGDAGIATCGAEGNGTLPIDLLSHLVNAAGDGGTTTVGVARTAGGAIAAGVLVPGAGVGGETQPCPLVDEICLVTTCRCWLTPPGDAAAGGGGRAAAAAGGGGFFCSLCDCRRGKNAGVGSRPDLVLSLSLSSVTGRKLIDAGAGGGATIGGAAMMEGAGTLGGATADGTTTHGAGGAAAVLR
mmetsp:Transcript_24935/g.45794  ORF Transcript_24935/g.45794 Transcript_24935/m.45794 type:complete len:367 (+) Transcript_24935:363-1463(+)